MACLAGTCALVTVLLAACGIRQAVYVPQGWDRMEDGAYRYQGSDLVASMPIMVVNKSDQTLHPAVSLRSKGHELRFVGATWTLAGKPLEPYSHVASGALIDSDAPLDLHWSTRGLGKIVPLLGAGSRLRIDVTVDHQPASVTVDLVRQDRY